MSEDKETDFIDSSLRRVHVDLLIGHPTMSPAEITAALGIEAHFAHRGGDPVTTPDGTRLEGHYYDTRWRHCIRHEVRDQHFADKITALVNSLVPHKAFFHHLRAMGGDAQVIVNFLGDGYLGDNVPLETLATMTELQLDFGIECFFMVPQSRRRRARIRLRRLRPRSGSSDGGAGSLERTRLRGISLFNRENTGSFRGFSRLRRIASPLTSWLKIPFHKNSLKNKTGKTFSETGNEKSDSGNLIGKNFVSQ